MADYKTYNVFGVKVREDTLWYICVILASVWMYFRATGRL